jgi:hypothetical protein
MSALPGHRQFCTRDVQKARERMSGNDIVESRIRVMKHWSGLLLVLADCILTCVGSVSTLRSHSVVLMPSCSAICTSIEVQSFSDNAAIMHGCIVTEAVTHLLQCTYCETHLLQQLQPTTTW